LTQRQLDLQGLTSITFGARLGGQSKCSAPQAKGVTRFQTERG